MLLPEAGVRQGSLSLSVATGTSSGLCLLAKLVLVSYFMHCMFVFICLFCLFIVIFFWPSKIFFGIFFLTIFLVHDPGLILVGLKIFLIDKKNNLYERKIIFIAILHLMHERALTCTNTRIDFEVLEHLFHISRPYKGSLIIVCLNYKQY